MRTLVRTSRCMASHTGSLGSGRPGSTFSTRVPLGQRLLAEADAVSRPHRLPKHDLVVGPETKTVPGDRYAELRKASDHLVAPVEADQRVVEQVGRLARAAAPVEIG